MARLTEALTVAIAEGTAPPANVVKPPGGGGETADGTCR
jgi:hypothetical protein